MNTDASRAHAIVAGAKTATLSTVAARPPGYPFGSLVAMAADASGRPLLLLSSLAEHTKNLGASSAASILVAEGDLSRGRVTLLGRCARIPEGEAPEARATYLAAHPEAEAWVSFRDFALYRLEVEEVRFVEGFGRMGWLAGEDYSAAARDAQSVRVSAGSAGELG